MVAKVGGNGHPVSGRARLTLIASGGVCTVLQAVPMIGQTVIRAVPDRVVPADGAADPDASRRLSVQPLLTFLGLSVLLELVETLETLG